MDVRCLAVAKRSEDRWMLNVPHRVRLKVFYAAFSLQPLALIIL
jgi:hypothetical protein